MPKVLVNYRRDDSAPYAGRLADRLREHFGRDNVFVDIDTIRPGEDFVERIDQSIAACDVLVAVIGKSWLTAADSQGRRRLDRDDDFVRMEIAKALEHHVRVIPALVGDASMPEPAQLPQNLIAMSRRHAIEISDSRFHHDVDTLIRALSDIPELQSDRAKPPQPVRPTDVAIRVKPVSRHLLLGGASLIAVLAVTGWFVLWRDRPSSQDTPAGGASSGTPPATGSAVTHDPPPGGATLAATGSPGGEPGAPLEAPPIAAAPTGKTGIQVVWRGTSSVPCYLFDETGTDALSPENQAIAWRCSRNMRAWDAAPGRYQIKFGGVAGTMPPLPITVTRGQVLRIEPRVGQLRLHWNGSNRVSWYLLDQAAGKTLSPDNRVLAWDCDAGKICTRDLGPGNYQVKVDAAGYQPVKVSIAAFRITDLTLP